MKRFARHRRSSRGFTLLEMLIVAMLGALMVTIISHTWKWYANSLSDLQRLTLLTKELKIATDAIAQDYGAAVASRSLDGETLQLDIDGGVADAVADWDSPDTVIEYSLDDGRLLRRDLTNDTAIPMASHISAMHLSTVDGHLQIHLVAEVRDVQQDITLQLQGS